MNRNFIYRIVELTNAKRHQAGLPELRFNPVLAAAAQKHSADMALEDFFSHVANITFHLRNSALVPNPKVMSFLGVTHYFIKSITRNKIRYNIYTV